MRLAQRRARGADGVLLSRAAVRTLRQDRRRLHPPGTRQRPTQKSLGHPTDLVPVRRTTRRRSPAASPSCASSTSATLRCAAVAAECESGTAWPSGAALGELCSADWPQAVVGALCFPSWTQADPGRCQHLSCGACAAQSRPATMHAPPRCALHGYAVLPAPACLLTPAPLAPLLASSCCACAAGRHQADGRRGHGGPPHPRLLRRARAPGSALAGAPPRLTQPPSQHLTCACSAHQLTIAGSARRRRRRRLRRRRRRWLRRVRNRCSHEDPPPPL